MPDPGRTALYRLFDANRRLLYIGIASNPDMRWGQHSVTKPWWSTVEARELEWHPTRAMAEAAERYAIQTELPVWNVAHTLSEAASISDIPPSVRKAMGPLERAELAIVKARRRLVEAVVFAIGEGLLGPTRVAQLAGWEPQTVRKYARENGVAPSSPGSKSPVKLSQLTGLPVGEVVERQRNAEIGIRDAVRELKRHRTRAAKLKAELLRAIKDARGPRPAPAPTDA